MSLRPKIVAILVAVVTAYSILDHSIQRTTLSKNYQRLEEKEAENDVMRVVEAISSELESIDDLCRSIASWDDAYAFMETGGTRFIESNLRRFFVDEKLRVDLIYYCAADGRVVWGNALDPNTREPIPLRDFPKERLARTNELLVSPRARALGHSVSSKGIMITERGPLLVSSLSVLNSAGQGDPRGTAIVGRFLGESLLEQLTRKARVPFTVWSVDDPNFTPAMRAAVDQVTSTTAPAVEVVDEETLYVYEAIDDLRAIPALLIRAELPRSVTAMGSTSIRYALNSTLAAGLLMLLVMVALIQKTVLTPISALTKHAEHIGRTDDLSGKLEMDRRDELGILSREFDNLMVKLEKSRADLVATARSAGMSEIATGILHNVGNVLNSVNVSASLLEQMLGKMSLSDLEVLTGLLEEQGDDLGRFVTEDPRGQHLLPFLNSLSEALVTERKELVDELGSLNGGIEHIRELITSQQDYAGRSEVAEWTSVHEPLEEAVRITGRALPFEDELELVRELEDLPRIKIDRHKLLEIAVNLIQNARQAMQGGERQVLTLHASVESSRLRVEFRDTGCGISAEILAKIFSHGFTTKDRGHGFGLHSSANAATELGGALTAESDGEGRGATFILELPCVVQEAASEEHAS